MRPRPHLAFFWFGLLALALLLQTQDTPGQVRHLDPMEKAPAFSLPGLDGATHDLADYRGRTLVLSLWASWCAPCREELPQFQRARQALARSHPGAALVTVNIDDSGARAKLWLKKQGLDLPVLLATPHFVSDYGVIVIPTILFIDAQGRLAAVREGWAEDNDLVQEIGAELDRMKTGRLH
ncbi:MAG: TlpA family protein disulfide reductase [Acidobacteriota bacterium]